MIFCWFLSSKDASEGLQRCFMVLKSKEVISNKISQIFVTRLLRKKYVMSKIYKEIDFLVAFYRSKNDKTDKKSKKLALKI